MITHFKYDPEGTRLPIKIDSTSNGEFAPVPLSTANIAGNNLALNCADEFSRKKGQSRRQFLVSACGAAATFLAFNKVNSATGNTGGYFQVSSEAALDEQLAASQINGNEFIFDVQGHFVNPTGAWLNAYPPEAKPLSFMPAAQCETPGSGPRDYLYCLGPESFVKDVFVESDTDMMVLSFIPSTEEGMPTTMEEADAVRQIVDEMEGSHRLLLHGRVNPNQDGDVERMAELVERWGISAFKTYTQYGPGGGFFLSDEETGIRMIEEARRLGVKNICVHKGIPFSQQEYQYSQSTDVGKVAARFPDMNFIIYHSSYVIGAPERAFVPGVGTDGVDTLIQSVIDNGIAPNSNVYAELGSTWRFLMRSPEDAAHALGKMFKYIGEDNVLWGTDSIWYGSPQDQIQAFRTFQISEEFQETYGYPEITPELRAKVFGLNATKPYEVNADEISRYLKNDKFHTRYAEFQAEPDPHFLTFGPRNRREFLNLKKNTGV